MKNRLIILILVTVILGVGGLTFFKQEQNNHPRDTQVAILKKAPKKATVVQTKDLKKKKSETGISYKKQEVNKESDDVSESDSYSDSHFENESSLQTTEPVQSLSSEFSSALNLAESYSTNLHMSKIGIYEQLISEYGENISPAAAQYAIDNMHSNWSNNALESAKSYQSNLGMSPEEIRDQLTSEYGEQFDQSEADYAVNNLY